MVEQNLRATLEKAQHEMRPLVDRYLLFSAFVSDLEKVSRGEEFGFRNEAVWTAMLDSRDMLIIHLADWCQAMLKDGGLLGKLQKHSGQFSKTIPKSRLGEDEHLNASLQETYKESFGRIFPDNDLQRIPQAKDFSALKELIKQKTTELQADRDQNRAHYYSQRQKKNAKAKMLNFNELKDLFEYFGILLNDLCLINHGSTWAKDYDSLRPNHIASNLVDLMLLGDLHFLPHWNDEVTREHFYVKLHDDLLSRPREPEDPSLDRWFNGPTRVRRALDAVGARLAP